MHIQYLYHMPGKDKNPIVYGKVSCDWCESPLGDMAAHYFNRDQRFGEKVFCPNCIRDIDPAYRQLGQPEWRWSKVVQKLPLGAVPILSPTEFTYSKTIQEAMTEKHDGVQIIDRTKWAGRDLQLDGSEQIGKSLQELHNERTELRLLE